MIVADASRRRVIPETTTTTTVAGTTTTTTTLSGAPLTGPELTGAWTTMEDSVDFWAEVDAETDLSHEVAGYSVQGRPIHRVELGNPGGSTLFLIANQHGAERGGRDGSMMWIRDQAYRLAGDLPGARYDYFNSRRIVLIPTLNPDGFVLSTLAQKGANADGVDLNRDWVNKSTVEVQIGWSVFQDCAPDLFSDLHGYDGTLTNTMFGVGPQGLPHPDIEALMVTIADPVMTAIEAAGYTTTIYESAANPATAQGAISLAHTVPFLMEVTTRQTKLTILRQAEAYGYALDALIDWHIANEAACQAAKAASQSA